MTGILKLTAVSYLEGIPSNEDPVAIQFWNSHFGATTSRNSETRKPLRRSSRFHECGSSLSKQRNFFMATRTLDLTDRIEPVLKRVEQVIEHFSKVVDAQQMMRGELQRLETLQKQHTTDDGDPQDFITQVSCVLQVSHKETI